MVSTTDSQGGRSGTGRAGDASQRSSRTSGGDAHEVHELPPTRTLVGSFAAAVGILLSGLYLLNLTFGGFIPLEIPDAIPILGNLDELTASAILFSCLAYFGVRLPFMHRKTVLDVVRSGRGGRVVDGEAVRRDGSPSDGSAPPPEGR